MNNKVILAMSGGVDSSVSAFILKKRGYSVTGLTFRVWPKSLCGKHAGRSCCSMDAIHDARLVCAKLDIPHYVVDCQGLFQKEVIDDFLRQYEEGLTPNPCIVCNEHIKFPILLQKAKETGASYIATGHYARVFKAGAGRYLIKEAKDKSKDQSYVLFGLKQDMLSRLLLPAGDHTKVKIRQRAKRLGLAVHDKPDSQEICFIPDNKTARFIKDNISDVKPGCILDKAGKVLGNHDGIALFTIGQREGLRIAYGRPIYVIDKDPDTGDIIVGEKKDTFKKSIMVKEINWLDKIDTARPVKAYARLRYKHPKAIVVIKMLSKHNAIVEFHQPQSSPCPGQAAVFYKKDTVIGGGWIQEALA